MRTTIDIDDALMAEAMAASGTTTKKVTKKALRGTVDWVGDLDEVR
ncbi:type II toxin-antitoxin system VapB family antitoxin [Actinophytocola gossypii]|uniref:Type II toxin-antitoxin system VapB family antitoxin n=1 Tax=Actinophytocola gossypii TaxID=2812003 RepID=A0ABT2JEE8_9PSEU|nr:type II toxin-antitoxin system VapB family antitoxin [Actinophytocola gossypii]MCT2586247.1 type II toxin-antitoxin system VapB family antitoxin [Actinophytocola gossypii]